MKLVIDIDDEQVLFDIKNQGLEAETDTDKVIINALYNGTPLPKGHGRLIDADEIQFENAEFDTYGDYSIAFDAIDQAETIIEADKEASDG